MKKKTETSQQKPTKQQKSELEILADKTTQAMIDGMYKESLRRQAATKAKQKPTKGQS